MPSNEVTALSPQEEQQFLAWVKANGIENVDAPESAYDMRGYWKDIASRGTDETEVNSEDGLRHFPDTYKQHGHPTFSVESKYSSGPEDGGRWAGDNFVPPGADLLGTSRRATPSNLLEQALLRRMKQR